MDNKSGIDTTSPKHSEKQKKTASSSPQKNQGAKENVETPPPHALRIGKGVCVVEGRVLVKDSPVHLKSDQRSLYQFQNVRGKDVENPADFPQCQMRMTFLRNPSGESKA